MTKTGKDTRLFIAAVVFAITTGELAVMITNRMDVSNSSRAIDLAWGIIAASVFYYCASYAKKSKNKDLAALGIFAAIFVLGLSLFFIMMTLVFQSLDPLGGLDF